MQCPGSPDEGVYCASSLIVEKYRYRHGGGVCLCQHQPPMECVRPPPSHRGHEPPPSIPPTRPPAGGGQGHRAEPGSFDTREPIEEARQTYPQSETTGASPTWPIFSPTGPTPQRPPETVRRVAMMRAKCRAARSVGETREKKNRALFELVLPGCRLFRLFRDLTLQNATTGSQTTHGVRHEGNPSTGASLGIRRQDARAKLIHPPRAGAANIGKDPTDGRREGRALVLREKKNIAKMPASRKKQENLLLAATQGQWIALSHIDVSGPW